MPLFVVVSASPIAYYMSYRHVRQRNYYWLLVKYRINFKVLPVLLTFKAIHGLAPPYISELVSVKDTNGRYSL